MFGVSLSGAFAHVRGLVNKILHAANYDNSRGKRELQKQKDSLGLNPSCQSSTPIYRGSEHPGNSRIR